MTATMTTGSAAAAPYLAAVRALLRDAPAAERDEILDDLEAHLAELAAEPGPSLAERLGTPSSYAAELVASVGITVTNRPPSPLARLRARWQMEGGLTWARQALIEAVPGWWVARALLVGVGLVVAIADARLADEIGGQILAVLLGIALLPPSVAIGRAARSGGTRWPDVAATTAAVVALLVSASALLSLPRHHFVDAGEPALPGVLTRSDGMPVTNIYAYDRQGRLVEVLLYDQDGRPLDDTGSYSPRDGAQLVEERPLDANGAVVGNLYPRTQQRVVQGPTGELREPVRPPAVVVPSFEDEGQAEQPASPPDDRATAPPG